VFDSWTKFQSGVSFGNRIDFGNFEQCLDFEHESDDSNVGVIQGQHCLIYYQATPNASSPATTLQSDGIFDWTEMWVLDIDKIENLIKIHARFSITAAQFWGKGSCDSVEEFVCHHHAQQQTSNNLSTISCNLQTYKSRMITINLHFATQTSELHPMSSISQQCGCHNNILSTERAK
jgi:hypothetical protein